MKTWVKLYTKSNRDPEMGSLTWAQRGIWSALLALGGEIDHRNGDGDETGELDTMENSAWRIRCSEDQFTNAIAEFQTRGWLEIIDGVLVMTNYGRLQARPREDPARVRARVARHRAKKRSPIFERDDWTCQYCGEQLAVKECSIDHIVPIAQGGSEDRSNLVTACMLCNDRKGARTPEQAKMPLRNDPRIVTSLRNGTEAEAEAETDSDPEAETDPEAEAEAGTASADTQIPEQLITDILQRPITRSDRKRWRRLIADYGRKIAQYALNEALECGGHSWAYVATVAEAEYERQRDEPGRIRGP